MDCKGAAFAGVQGRNPWPSLLLALLLAFAIGVAHTLLMLPLPTVLGTGAFWAFPRGIIPGGLVDMGQELMGYRYLAQAPWLLPLLHVPNIAPPAGMNAFWLDPVPWLGLLARPVSALAGHTVNLLGWFVFFAFALPGVALTALLRAAGQRGLSAAAAAALLADPMPSLLFEWGHIALCAQVLVLAALALYVAGRHDGARRPWRWALLLGATLLTHLYLFVMVGGIWAAAQVQAALELPAARRRLALQAALTVGAIAALGLLTGILSRDVGSGGTTGFGVFSMNLASPFLPQLSGAIPPLRGYWVGGRSQVLAWPGLGAWLVLLAALAFAGRRWPWALARRHPALALVLLGFVLFALSNRITLGNRVLLALPLPDGLAYALGAFRASGRFVWPVLDAALAAGLLALLRQARRGPALAVLAAACVLQVVDAGPIRAAIAASASHPLAPVLDRAAAAAEIAPATALLVFPSSGCIGQAIDPAAPDPPAQQEARLNQANVELQLLASQKNLPLNTVVNSRLATDCGAEAALRQAGLRPGAAYFYLAGPPPAAAQLGGRDPQAVCRRLGWVLACRIPA
jgi:hypothetical protein